VLKSGDAIAVGVDFTTSDAQLIKINSTGSVLKSQRIAGSGADEAQAVAATADGGAVIVGSTTSFGEGNTDAFILKIRASGGVAWRRTFGTSGNEHFVRVVQTSDKGFIALGDADHDPNLNDIVVVKFTSGGRFVWRTVVSGGTFDHASDLRLTAGNGAIVAIAADFPEGVRSILAKFASNGTVEWSRIYGSSGDHIALSVFQTADGGYYFTEIFRPSGSQKSQTILSKLDAAGIPQWSRSYKSSAGNLAASVTSIIDGQTILLSGNITAPNGRNSKGVLIGLDENGALLWRKRVKPDSRPVFLGQPVVSNNDSSILISGCNGDRAANNMDNIVLKTQTDGTIQGGCAKLVTFPLTSARYTLTNSSIVLDQIPVPFFSASAGFAITSFTAGESFACTGQ
jgi:hypothetical protein